MSDSVVYETVRYGLITLGIVLIMLGASVIESDEWVACRATNPSIPGFYTCMGTVTNELADR